MQLALGHVLALSAAVVWSLNFTAIRHLHETLNPFTVASMRYAQAGAIALVIWAVRRPRLGRLTRRHWGMIVAFALLIGPVYQVLLNYGARGTSAGLIGLITASQTLHVAWASSLVLQEKLTAQRLVAIALAFAGLSLPIVLAGQIGYTHWHFPAVVIVTSMIAATNVILPRRMSVHVGAVDLTALVMIIAAVASLPLFALGGAAEVRQLDAGGWGAIVWLGTIGHVFAFILWYTALRRLRAVAAGFYLFVMMMLSSLWGYLLLSEPWHWTYAAAAVAVLVGLYLNATGGPAPRPDAISAQAAAAANPTATEARD